MKIGDYVVHRIYPGPEFKVDDQYYFIVNERDIIAVWRDADV